jgi:hypothetical protein
MFVEGRDIYGEKFAHFPHILGSPSSYMTLQPIPSEFPYICENIVLFFISVQGHESVLYNAHVNGNNAGNE